MADFETPAFLLTLGNYLPMVLVCLVAAAALALPFAYYWYQRHESEARLAHYGKVNNGKPLASYVCPTCLHRTYAPKHIEEQHCIKCAAKDDQSTVVVPIDPNVRRGHRSAA